MKTDSSNLIHGHGVSLITPFNPTGEVDYPALERLAKNLMVSKVDFIVVLGHASEAALLKALPLGATGSITATANVQAGAIAKLIEAWDHSPAEAEALFPPIEAVRKAVQSRSFISPQKRALSLIGDKRWATVRPPLSPATVEDGEALAREIGLM